MYYYFAQFLPDVDQPDVYSVSFPDLPGCDTFGTGMEDAFKSSKDALEGYIDVEAQLGHELPAASSYEVAKDKAEQQCRELGIEIPEGTVYQLVPAELYAQQPVRLNITMNPRVLELIDRVRVEQGMTRSGFLAAAAKEYAQKQSL